MAIEMCLKLMEKYIAIPTLMLISLRMTLICMIGILYIFPHEQTKFSIYDDVESCFFTNDYNFLFSGRYLPVAWQEVQTHKISQRTVSIEPGNRDSRF